MATQTTVRDRIAKAQADFDTSFAAFVKDGEQVRDQALASLDEIRNRIIKHVKTTRKEVTRTAESALQAVLDYSPVATRNDLEKLDRKLNKVLAQVAK